MQKRGRNPLIKLPKNENHSSRFMYDVFWSKTVTNNLKRINYTGTGFRKVKTFSFISLNVTRSLAKNAEYYTNVLLYFFLSFAIICTQRFPFKIHETIRHRCEKYVYTAALNGPLVKDTTIGCHSWIHTVFGNDGNNNIITSVRHG